jgi:hypothetical protein
MGNFSDNGSLRFAYFGDQRSRTHRYQLAHLTSPDKGDLSLLDPLRG